MADKPAHRPPNPPAESGDWVLNQPARDVLHVQVADDLIRGWRTTLTDANAQVLQTISGSMAGAVALESFSRIPELISFQSTPTMGRISEQLTPYLTSVRSSLTAELQRFVQPAALAAATDFAARMRTTTERYRRYQEALWDLEWWVPPSVPLNFFMEVGLLAERGRRVELRRRMVEAGRSRLAQGMVNGWMDLEPFRQRRRFILDGVRDLRDGRYRVSIPTLLPLLEGISIDAFAPGSTLRSPVPALTSSASLSAAAGDAIVETVTLLWAHQDFAATSPTSRRLNRHLIMHGRSTGYGTAANAVKVLFALDQLASMVRRGSE